MANEDYHHSEPGRRSYDIEIAELRFEMKAMREENKELKDEVKDLKKEVKNLVDIMSTAKGMNAAVRWIAGTIIAVGAAIAVLKGWLHI